MPTLLTWLLVTLALLLGLGPAVAAADVYPSKPVRLIVPFPPGGSNDIVGRMIGAQLGERLGKQVIVDNRAGAGGTLGTEIAAKSPPDGYTLLMISAAYAFNSALYKLPYDPAKAFVPVSMLGTGPNVLAVFPGLPVNSLKELIALAKAKPGQLNYAAAGVGSFQHLASELFKMTAGVDIVGVQFKGGGAGDDRRGGRPHPDLARLAHPGAAPHPLGQAQGAGRQRLEAEPRSCPRSRRSAEAGLPGYEAYNWWGLVAPAGTPPAVVERLHKELAGDPDLRGDAEAAGGRRGGGGPDEPGRVRRVRRRPRRSSGRGS